MEKVLVLLVSFVCFSNGFPADHREDTVLPFSLSPGPGVNLETYYLDKYPKSGAGGPLQKPQPPLSVDGNVFQENENGPAKKDAHAIFRTRRNPQYYPYHTRHLNNNYGHEQHQMQMHQHQSSYGYERHHHQANNRYHNQYQNQPYYNNHFHG